MKVKAAFLTTCSMAGVIFVPHFLGRLLAFVFPDSVEGAYWPWGIVVTIVAVAVCMVWYTVYGTIYDYLKEKNI